MGSSGRGGAWRDLATPVQLRGMRTAITAQCFGVLGWVMFQGSVVLVYMKALGVSDAAIMTYLAFIGLGDALFRAPSAYLADRVGKKRVGVAGALTQAVCFGAIALAGFLPRRGAEATVAFATFGYAAGMGLMVSSWYALLSAVVPPGLRGRFFGALRLCWQGVGIAFTGACALLLSRNAPVGHYQLALGIVTIAVLIRVPIYMRIPDLDPRRMAARGLAQTLGSVMKAQGYMSFCAYVFLLACFTTGVPAIFGLIEKEVLGFGDNQVVWMGSLAMAGGMVAYALAGNIVDRWGTKPMFLVCHLGFGAALFLFLARGAFGAPLIYVVGALHALYGALFAASTIAISVELLAITRPENKSFATSLCMSFWLAGGGLSGLVSAGIVKLGFLKERWELLGAAMSHYDAILLMYGCMVVGLVVTLGLVPSIIGGPQAAEGRGRPGG